MTTRLPSSLNSKQFLAQFSKSSVIDVNHLSKELKSALDANKLSEKSLQAIAGADGQIKGDEFKKLFTVLDGFEAKAGDKKLTLRDDAGQTSSGSLNDAIKAEVARNALEARYSQPGSAPAPLQPRKTDVDALTVTQARKPISLAVTGKSQFTWGKENGFTREESGHKCFDAALWQTTEFAARAFPKKTPVLNGPDQAIQVAYREDENGRLEVDPTQAQLARGYIDRALEKGLPVMVGVSYEDSNYNNDRMTDHFVTISGRGTDALGREFYSFKDPGAGGREGKFLVDKETGKLFRQGPRGDAASYVEDSDYEVTQVRTWKGIE